MLVENCARVGQTLAIIIFLNSYGGKDLITTEEMLPQLNSGESKNILVFQKHKTRKWYGVPEEVGAQTCLQSVGDVFWSPSWSVRIVLVHLKALQSKHACRIFCSARP